MIKAFDLNEDMQRKFSSTSSVTELEILTYVQPARKFKGRPAKVRCYAVPSWKLLTLCPQERLEMLEKMATGTSPFEQQLFLPQEFNFLFKVKNKLDYAHSFQCQPISELSHLLVAECDVFRL